MTRRLVTHFLVTRRLARAVLAAGLAAAPLVLPLTARADPATYESPEAAVAAVALAVGLGAAWYVVTEVFDLPFRPDWGDVGATVGASVAVTMLVGVLGTWPVLRVRPAEALRDA